MVLCIRVTTVCEPCADEQRKPYGEAETFHDSTLWNRNFFCVSFTVVITSEMTGPG